MAIAAWLAKSAEARALGVAPGAPREHREHAEQLAAEQQRPPGERHEAVRRAQAVSAIRGSWATSFVHTGSPVAGNRADLERRRCGTRRRRRRAAPRAPSWRGGGGLVAAPLGSASHTRARATSSSSTRPRVTASRTASSSRVLVIRRATRSRALARAGRSSSAAAGTQERRTRPPLPRRQVGPRPVVGPTTVRGPPPGASAKTRGIRAGRPGLAFARGGGRRTTMMPKHQRHREPAPDDPPRPPPAAAGPTAPRAPPRPSASTRSTASLYLLWGARRSPRASAFAAFTAATSSTSAPRGAPASTTSSDARCARTPSADASADRTRERRQGLEVRPEGMLLGVVEVPVRGGHERVDLVGRSRFAAASAPDRSRRTRSARGRSRPASGSAGRERRRRARDRAAAEVRAVTAGAGVGDELPVVGRRRRGRRVLDPAWSIRRATSTCTRSRRSRTFASVVNSVGPLARSTAGTERTYEMSAWTSLSGSQRKSSTGMKRTDRPSRLIPWRMMRASSPSEYATATPPGLMFGPVKLPGARAGGSFRRRGRRRGSRCTQPAERSATCLPRSMTAGSVDRAIAGMGTS